MGPGLVSLFITIGACGWLYGKLQRRSGNNTQQSLVAIGVVGVFIFILAWSLTSLFL